MKKLLQCTVFDWVASWFTPNDEKPIMLDMAIMLLKAGFNCDRALEIATKNNREEIIQLVAKFKKLRMQQHQQ